MICTLMHKRLAVAELELDEATGSIIHINTVYTPEHLPVGTCALSGAVDRAALNQWWTGRCIPTTRLGIREALETLGLPSPQLLPLRSYGLSLSDHYWISPKDAGVTWDTINFYDNPFSDDVGSVLFGQPKPSAGVDFCSPDNTTDGYLRKCWKIVDGARCLIKGGSAPFQQQPFNEVIASIPSALEQRPALLGVYGLCHPGHRAGHRLAGDADSEKEQSSVCVSAFSLLLSGSGGRQHRARPGPDAGGGLPSGQ